MRDLLKPLQVYVVEDSTVIRRLLASAIAAAGGELIGYSADADKAISDLTALRPDLVVIDIALRTGTGFDVLEALQRLDPKPAPIKVVLTNHASPEYRQVSLHLGANGFFDKATQTSELLTLISALAMEKRNGAILARAPAPHMPKSDSLH
jgi:DNA-binding NarL/FixJ family response regulator